MCDDMIHQGLTHDPTVTRRTFGLGAAASIALQSKLAAAQAKVVQKDVDVKMESGVSDSALFYPEGKGPWPAVLVWTDILGLRPVFREMGQRLAAEGYVVLVPNPFYRNAKAPVVDGSFDFSKPEDRAKVMPMAAALTAEANISDAKAYTAFLDAQPQTNKKKKMGVQGYCMGGPLTFRTAATIANRIGAAATFHGGGLVSDKPDSPHLLIPKMKAEVLCAVADNDDKRDPTAKDKLKEAFAAAHLKATVEVYEGCNHGWTVRGSQVYNEAGAERAWSELLALYKRNLA
ncbi:dienelactone hydrolase family protein [Occallatibacter riparius]|uniref:Dienelactone hydrolase family protein n=1 Tax=Occallatibacter riparius TaxID=1002689 RepID=A0A9J7BLH3_9BACT|nr:dienelactone hydrolase family protein [Occallatibacter riparius]UWZ83495.1 dienelactone hydrolase family protein [Occallatibacter riparius]